MKKFFTFLLTTGEKGARILITANEELQKTLRNSESAEKQTRVFVEKNGTRKNHHKTTK